MPIAPSGIYKITNQKTGRVYVGQSKNVYFRRAEHFVALRRGYHENKLMQKEWNEDNHGFRWDVIEFCPIEKLNEREKYWIDTLNTKEPCGFNKGWVPYKRKIVKPKRKQKHYHKSS